MLLPLLVTATLAFISTNIDDILLLVMWFAQPAATIRKRHIVAGQYLGFIATIAISLLGFAGVMVLPPAAVGLLGLLPIALGIRELLKQRRADNDDDDEQVFHPAARSRFYGLISPQTYAIAAVTLANGADNVSLYVPLFASHRPADLAVIIVVFLLLMGLWCYIAYRLVRHPLLARLLARYGERLLPFVLIGLGVYIVWESVFA
ncbi:MAG: cadmium resistance transporter [Anaerolineae bacterium]